MLFMFLLGCGVPELKSDSGVDNFQITSVNASCDEETCNWNVTTTIQPTRVFMMVTDCENRNCGEYEEYYSDFSLRYVYPGDDIVMGTTLTIVPYEDKMPPSTTIYSAPFLNVLTGYVLIMNDAQETCVVFGTDPGYYRPMCTNVINLDIYEGI